MDDPKLKMLFHILSQLIFLSPFPLDGDIFVDPRFAKVRETIASKFGKHNCVEAI
jgi:hypothetical protein